MKHLFVAIMLVGVFSLQAQIDVKGIVLGQPTEKTIELTTLGGINVAIIPYSLNDGRVYQVLIAPSKDGVNINRIYTTDVERLKNGFEKKYAFRLRKIPKEYGDDYYLKGEIPGADFYFIVETNQYMDPSTKLSIIVSDPYLEKINEKEQQAKANADF